MSLKSKIEALIYAAEDPISLDQLAALLKEDLAALKADAEPSAPEAPAAVASAPETPQLAEPAPAAAGENAAPANAAPARDRKRQRSEKAEVRELLQPILDELTADYAREDRGIEVRQVAGGYRMSTKPEHHDVIRAFAKSLKPPIKLSLPALETLAVIAYKQPVTVPEISEIRGVDAGGVIGTLLERKLITTAGRKAVVGRPIQYKTSKDFLLRFGLNDINDLPSLEEFEKLAAGELQEEPPSRDAALADATGVPDEGGSSEPPAEDQAGTSRLEIPPVEFPADEVLPMESQNVEAPERDVLQEETEPAASGQDHDPHDPHDPNDRRPGDEAARENAGD